MVIAPKVLSSLPTAEAEVISLSHFYARFNSQSNTGGIGTDMFIFGRPRQQGVSASEPMIHPLFVDQTNSNGGLISAQSQARLTRRPPRTLVAAGNYGDVMQSLENIVGGGALQFFQELVGRGGTADIRVEVPTAQLLGHDRGHTGRHGRGAIRASVRLERDARTTDGRSDNHDNFSLMHTLQRWAEESKMSHGKFLQERISRLSNHIVIALLPEAREAKKRQEERERAEKERAEAVKEPEVDETIAVANAQGVQSTGESDDPRSSIPVDNQQESASQHGINLDADAVMVDIPQDRITGVQLEQQGATENAENRPNAETEAAVLCSKMRGI